MITRLSRTTIWVLDPDDALEFYTLKLGFQRSKGVRYSGTHDRGANESS
jgi:catechol 2,3-dioxygenase-like lactoylglutathione lyase family enzyme